MNSTYVPPIHYPTVLTETLTYTISGSSGAAKNVTANQYATLPYYWATSSPGVFPNYFTSFTRIATGSSYSLIAGYEPYETDNKIAVRVRNYSSSALSDISITLDYQTPAIR